MPVSNAFDGIDLNFRPRSYFRPVPLETHLLARIKGTRRKAAVQRLLDGRSGDGIEPWLSDSSLDDLHRQALERAHPAWMGGEYLPNLHGFEVEIARITLASVTQDVTAIYARRGSRRIHYRVADDYKGETLQGRTTRTSVHPLTLGEIERFFNEAWSLIEVLDMNFADFYGYDPDDLLQYAQVESDFYPQFSALCRKRIEIWAAQAKQRELRV